MKDKVTMLMILDGFGINDTKEGNAIKLAKTPNIDKIIKKYPTSLIETSGKNVGLPDGQIGGWEVGQTNIEAGRVVDQALSKITKSIENGDFFSNAECINAIENCKKNKSKLHIMGLLSDGGIHSHIRHLYALLEMAKRRDFEDIYIHCFLDGRDTSPVSAEGFITDLEEKIKEKGIGKIASISGRYYSMDKDNNWDRIKKVYDALINGKGNSTREAIPAIEQSYQQEIFDEFVEPILITSPEGIPVKIEENDSIICFNYRADRVSQLIRALVEPEFNEFKTKKINLYFVSFANLEKEIKNVHDAYKKEKLKNTFEDVLKKQNLNHISILENNSTYELHTEKNAMEVTNKAIEAIESGKYNFIKVIYSDLDIVGHTGNLTKAIKAVQVIDKCVGKILKSINNNEGNLIITADYGNCEQIIDYKTGEPHTAHTINPVPLIIVSNNKNVKLKDGNLSDIAPTILKIMEIDKPKEMAGQNLLEDDKRS